MGIRERKEREFQRREEEILAAALALFDREDWRAVTIEEIAQAAEIGKGTVYKHFPSKEDIYARLALAFHTSLLEQLRAVPADLPVLDRLRAMVRTFWDFRLQGTRYHRLIHYCERGDFLHHITEENRSRMMELDAAFGELLEAVVRRGQAEGLFELEKPVSLILFGPRAALQGAIRMVEGGCESPADPETCLQEITEFVIAGLTGTRTADVRT